jgi:lysophospholipase L1-like esterase
MQFGMGLGVLVMVMTLGGSAAWAQVDLGDIMAMGDSITEGAHVNGGYRSPLYTQLMDADYDLQYVGSMNYWSDSTLWNAGQQWHEGHGGKGVQYFRDNLDTFIGEGGEDPDIILLMIGINDLDTDEDPIEKAQAAAQNLNALIGDIYDIYDNRSDEVTLYVASLTYRKYWDDRVAEFNSHVPGIVAGYQTLGRDIHFVNMDGVLSPADLEDVVHPNAAGYQKLGTAWFKAIHANAPEPGTAMLLLIGSAGLWLKRKRGKLSS